MVGLGVLDQEQAIEAIDWPTLGLLAGMMVIVALTEWGDRWAAPEGPPVVFEHEGCGGRVRQRQACEVCDVVPAPDRVTARPGHQRRRPAGEGGLPGEPPEHVRPGCPGLAPRLFASSLPVTRFMFRTAAPEAPLPRLSNRAETNCSPAK